MINEKRKREIQEQKEKMSIKEHLEEFMSDEHNELCRGGCFSSRNFTHLIKALTGELDNFVVFDNAGGKAFDIVQHDEGIDGFVKDMKLYVYMYKMNGKETILRNLPTSY